jgi:hypothetical protein
MVHKLLRSPAAVAILMVSAGSARADSQAGGDAVPQEAPHAEVRNELLAEFTYTPPPVTPPETSVILNAGVAAPDPVADAVVVTMEPYTVRENLRMEYMHSQILEQHAKAKTDLQMRRLGVGIHSLALGPVHLFAGTVFYIPFVIGGGVAW